MINHQRLEQSISRTNFHGPKHVRAIMADCTIFPNYSDTLTHFCLVNFSSSVFGHVHFQFKDVCFVLVCYLLQKILYLLSANSTDADQILLSAMSVLGMHCLSVPFCGTYHTIIFLKFEQVSFSPYGRMSGNHCRPWWDTAFCAIWSCSTLFSQA